MKKSTPIVLLATAVVFCSASLFGQADAKKKQKAPPLPGAGTGGNTPHATTSAVLGPDRNEGGMVTITYGRPFRTHPRTNEQRKVWGGLVKWDKADRLGADEATTLVNEYPIEIGGTTLPAGAYTLYIIPSESGTSKLAISKHIGKWGVPVDEKNDIARVDLTKESLSETVEQLTITIAADPPRSMNGVIKIAWENTQFSVPFKMKKS
jgi:hypothetical protein